MKAVILGAGRGARLMPHTSEVPKCLLDGLGGRKLLDWTVEALYGAGLHDVVFVAGYQADKVKRHAPALTFVMNPEWEKNNVLASLFYAEEHFDGGLVVSYADTVYTSKAVEAVLKSDSDVALVVDRQWRTRYLGRDAHPESEAEKVVMADSRAVSEVGKLVNVESSEAEFIGVAKFSATAADIMSEIYHAARSKESPAGFGRADSLDSAYLTDMIEELIRAGVGVEAVDLVGDWIEIDTPQDLELAREFLAGGMADSLTREFWAIRAKRYQEVEWAQRNDYIKSVVDAAELHASDRVLDVGTGTGVVAHSIAPHVTEVVGIDISPDMLEWAKASAAPNEVFDLGDVRKLLYEDASFDKVVGRMVFHHILPDPIAGLLECHRVLRPGGLMVLSEGTPPDEHVRDWYTEMFALKEERLTFLEGDLRNLMLRAGFDIHKVVVVVTPKVSIRNWLDSSGLSEEIRNRIYQMHLDLDERGKQLYNMRVEVDDILCDFRFINVVGGKPADD